MEKGDSSKSPSAEGRCLCGKVRYRVVGALGEVRFCHCTRCQKATGSAFSANARVPAACFTLLEGRELVREYEQSEGVFRAFCSVCGSPVYARLAREPAHVRVRLGGLSGDLDVRVTAHVWVSSKSPWHAITDALPQYPEAMLRGGGEEP